MITIRPATPDDAAALQALYALNITEADWLPEPAKQAPVFADVSRDELVHLAVGDAGQVLGFSSVQTAGSFIHHLHVHPDARGRGVGQALLDALQTWLPQPWRLKCVRKNVGALRFYRRGGWEELGAGESEHGPFLVLGWAQSQN